MELRLSLHLGVVPNKKGAFESPSTMVGNFTYIRSLVLFNPYTGPYQVLPLQAWVDLGAMAMKGYSAFPKASV